MVTRIYLSLLFLVFTVNAVASDDAILADSFFSQLASGSYIKAANLIHYPSTYTARELEVEKKTLAVMIKSICEELGTPSNYQLSNSGERYAGITISAGDFKYWQQYPNFMKSTYEVNYGNDGRGFVELTYHRENSAVRLRSISFNLPASKDNLVRRFTEILNKMEQAKSKLDLGFKKDGI